MNTPVRRINNQSQTEVSNSIRQHMQYCMQKLNDRDTFQQGINGLTELSNETDIKYVHIILVWNFL